MFRLVRTAVALAVLTAVLAEGFGALPVVNGTVSGPLPFFATCSPPCVENFDSVSPPTLPTGWTATVSTQPPDRAWETVNTQRDTFPNSVFAGAPNHVTDNRLMSRAFATVSTPATLTFRRRNDLETGFDGMVLEISIDGGAFVDIIAAGGLFTLNGYNGSISTSFGNPLAGRSAWTGITNDFVTTTVNLPASVNGRNVTFRWRVGTDSSVGTAGAFIDSVSLIEVPPNDNLINAQPLSLGTSGVVAGSNVGATKEPMEPNHAGDVGGSSVWYRWQAPETDRFTFITYHSSFDTLLAVYTGNSYPLAHVVSNDNDVVEILSPCFSGRASRVSFNATAGVVYRIAVDRHSGESPGNIVLRWGRSARIEGRITSAGGGTQSRNQIRLQGDICRDTEALGTMLFTDIPTDGRYEIVFAHEFGENFSRWGTSDSISPLIGNVSNFNYYQDTPAANIEGTVTFTNGDGNGLTVTCVSSPTPLVSRTAALLGNGRYQCNLPSFANYVVTPAKLGITFSPANRTVLLGSANVFLVDFTGTLAPTRVISGRATYPNGTTGASGVSITLSGSQTASTVTNANGNYTLTGVLQGGNYTVTPSKTNLTFTPVNQNFTNLAGDQAANFTATFPLQVMLDQLGQVAALDSVIMVRDPFPVVNSGNLLSGGVDRNTRVNLFLWNFQLEPTEGPSAVVINLVGSNNQNYDIPAEAVIPVSNLGFTQIVFRLPDTLTAGNCALGVKARGVTSNLGVIRIRN